jgi:hypothetical protein
MTQYKMMGAMDLAEALEQAEKDGQRAEMQQRKLAESSALMATGLGRHADEMTPAQNDFAKAHHKRAKAGPKRGYGFFSIDDSGREPNSR